MNLPSDIDIREAQGYAVFLRGCGSLRRESRMLCDLGIETQRLRDWIREEGKRTNMCTFDILRGEVCESCRCGRADGGNLAELADRLREGAR